MHTVSYVNAGAFLIIYGAVMAVSVVLTIISGVILFKEVRKKAISEGTVSKRVPSAAEGLTI